jgi:hypothetical protein
VVVLVGLLGMVVDVAVILMKVDDDVGTLGSVDRKRGWCRPRRVVVVVLVPPVLAGLLVLAPDRTVVLPTAKYDNVVAVDVVLLADKGIW